MQTENKGHRQTVAVIEAVNRIDDEKGHVCAFSDSDQRMLTSLVLSRWHSSALIAGNNCGGHLTTGSIGR